MKNALSIQKSQLDEDQEKQKRQFEFDQFGNMIDKSKVDLEKLKNEAKEMGFIKEKYKDEYEQKDKLKSIYMIQREKKMN